MPKKTVEQNFCDHPGCELASDYLCRRCSRYFCLSHRLQVWIGTNIHRPLCFSCGKKAHPCLTVDIEQQEKYLAALPKPAKPCGPGLG